MTHHPATYSKELFEPIRDLIKEVLPGDWPYYERAYDPMAGTGKLAEILEPLGIGYVGCELEREWATMDARTIWDDCCQVTQRFRLIVCSPPYGNRMADNYLGTPIERALRAETGKMPRRRSYAISLGRRPSLENAGALHWGTTYRDMMTSIWTHVVNVNLAHGGHFILNVASHYRANDYQPVAEWHIDAMLELGLVEMKRLWIETPGYRDGDNKTTDEAHRDGGEWLVLFRKP